MNAISVNLQLDAVLENLPPEVVKTLRREALRRGVPIADVIADAAIERARAIVSAGNKQAA